MKKKKQWKRSKPVEYVYIGVDYYAKSGTMMSSIYLVKNKKYERSDLSQMFFPVKKRKRILVRPPTKKEIKMFDLMLIRRIERLEEMKK